MEERESWLVVGRRVRWLRKENGLTLKQLARGCDLSANTISLIERGLVAPTIETLCKIAHALGVSAGSLFSEVCAAEVVLNRASVAPYLSVNQGSQNRSIAVDEHPGPPEFQAEGVCVPQIFCTVMCVSGRMRYEVDERSYDLGPGDSLTFYGEGRGVWRNPSGEAGVAIMFLPPKTEQDVCHDGPIFPCGG